MLADKRVLALCITKIHDKVRGDLVDQMNRAANKAGYKLLCFHSPEDFYIEDFERDYLYNVGAKSVFERIDYSVVDGLILCAEYFRDEHIVDEILSRAAEHKIPAVIVNGEKSGYCQVAGDGREAFQGLVRHLICDHGARDLFFLGGRREKDPYSAVRLSYYREVLRECGISDDESRVDYGDFEEKPAMEIVQRLAEEGRLPGAFVCANDKMAFGVCTKLKELGRRVPEDVIVTGFDGVPAVDYLTPRLSTCREDRAGIAEKCIETFTELFEGRKPERKKMVPYTRILSESCGCCRISDRQRNDDADKLYRLLDERDAYEDFLTVGVNELLNGESMEGVSHPIARSILAGSVYCVNSWLLSLASGKEPDHMTVAIPSIHNKNRSLWRLPDEDMLPETEGFAEDDTCYVINAVYSKDSVCGYFAVRTNCVNEVAYKIRKISRYFNLVANSLLNQLRQNNMMKSIENAGYMDSMTRLQNLKGITKWYEEFSQVGDNHRKTLAISIYALSNYTYIYENYGIRAIEEVSNTIANSLRSANPKNCAIARVSESEFLVINYFEDPEKVSVMMQNADSVFFASIEDYNRSSGDYYLEINAGSTVASAGWDGRLEVFIKFASGELFLNRLKQEASAREKEAGFGRDDYSVFNLLLDNNLFTYYFQPIVDAKTGEIQAYEALMRTTGGINLTPLEVLDIARESNRLNEIEHATLFNVMKRYTDDCGKFWGRKVFINTIPNHFLSDEECDELIREYRDHFDSFVFEVTEQESSPDEELEAIKRLSGWSGETQVAVDDYGTGHSNIVNLLRYAPQIIKIDRYLISGIDSDTNKQMFVKNTIEFASMNNIKVLAEGVETAEELRTVIRYGVDLIQGYYTGRPVPEPIESIDEAIRDEIIEENIRLTRCNSEKNKTYVAKDGETLNLVNLVLEKYSYINISSGEVTLRGKKDCTLNIITKITDNADVTIRLWDVNLSGTDEPAFQLGQGSEVRLELGGFNTITKDGIWVRKNAMLRIAGDGTLMVNCNRNEGVCIGSKFEEPYGGISFEHTGRVKVISSGDRVVCVGGGYSSSAIEVKSGILEVTGSGVSVVGIGSAMGNADIRIGEAEIAVKESANEAVGIGTITGVLQIVSRGRLNVTSDGENAVAIGSLKGKDGTTKLESGTVTAVVHCDMGTVLGSLSGSVTTLCDECHIKVYGEGANVAGIGSFMGSCTTEISGGILEVKVLSANAQPFGNESDKLIITGGNVMPLGDEAAALAVNAYGQKLRRQLKDGDYFEQVVRTPDGEYVYTAKRCPEQDLLCVYLP